MKRLTRLYLSMRRYSIDCQLNDVEFSMAKLQVEHQRLVKARAELSCALLDLDLPPINDDPPF